MLNFKSVEIADRARLEPVFRAQPYRACDQSFPSLYIWEKTYPGSFVFEDGVLFVKYQYPDGHLWYQMPLGAGDKMPQAIELLRQDAKDRGVPFLFGSLTKEMCDEIEAAAPGKFEFAETPQYADYIYYSENLRELKGKKLHAKRNYLNRFRAEYEGRYEFEAVTAENADEVFAFNLEWDREHGFSDAFIREADAIHRALMGLEDIGLVGVALRLDGKIIAYALGSELCADTMLEEFEKAADINGAYQMINNEFARRFCEGYTYINREEDLGLEGLRKAKQSYFPAFLNMRWEATYRE
jgi:hypothetical protein